MAYATVTLSGTYQTPDQTPHKGHVEIIPSERVIKDTTGDVILTGRVKVDLDAQGAFSVVLPATDDPGLNPTGFGYTIAAKLHSSHPPAVSFTLPASLGATTVEDLTPVDPSTFAPTTTYAESSEVAALDTRVTTLETTPAVTSYNDLTDTPSLATVATSGNYTDLAGQPTIPTAPGDIGAEPAGLSQATNDTLSATYASRSNMALVPPSLQRVTKTATGGGPRLIDQWGGYLWGVAGTTGDLYRSTDGTTWTLVTTTYDDADGFISRLIPTADGEVLAVNAKTIKKSSGWATNPATCAWSATKITPLGSSVFNGFGVDGDGTKFIAVEYAPSQVNWPDSRYGWISTDAGTTWTAAWDSNVEHAGVPGESHLHLACYDPWGDVFYIGEGHGSAGGVYYSTDDGATWGGPLRTESASPSIPNNAPTVMLATDDGFVFGSDNYETGLFGMLRKDNPADQAIVRTWALATGREGLVAFAQRALRDPDTGMVFVSFRSEYDDTPITLAAGTPSSGGLVYQDPTMPVTGGADRFVAMARVGPDELVMYGEIASTPYHFRGVLTKPGAGSDVIRRGNVNGGTAAAGDSVAAGAGSTASGIRSTAAGPKAKASGQDSTAVGHNAQATATSTAALGAASVASAQNAVAFPGQTADKVGQIKIGPRFLEIGKVSLPAVPDDGYAQIFVQDDGSGAQEQIMVQFRTGARQVIATERGLVTSGVDLAHTFNHKVVVFTSSVSRTFTLLSAVGRNGLQVTVKNAGSAVLNIASTAGTIDGAASDTLAQWESATYISDGANWLII